MATLSVIATYQLLRAAGFTADRAVVMTAIGISESGLNVDAVGDVGLEDSTWGPSVGLFQERTERAQTGTGGVRDVATLKGNAAAQARAAFETSDGGRSFTPWTTFTSGAYLGNLAKVRGALSGADLSAPVAPAPATGPAGDAGDLASSSGAGFHLPNPISGLGKLLGLDSAADSVVGGVAKIVITGTALAAGVALVVIGVYRGVQPTVQKIQSAAVEVGEAVATDGASVAAKGASSGAAAKGAGGGGAAKGAGGGGAAAMGAAL